MIENTGAKLLFETDWKFLSDLKICNLLSDSAENKINDEGLKGIVETSLNSLRDLDLCTLLLTQLTTISPSQE